MSSKIKWALGYLLTIVASIVFLVAVHSLTVGGPSGTLVIGYVMAVGYAILRLSLMAKKIVIKNKWASVLLRIFILLCAIIVFAGVSGFHGGSEEAKTFAAVIALVMAIEAGWQVKRLSILPNE